MRISRALPAAALFFALQGSALACPFCGGKGASGLAENLLIVVGLWFGARALMRSLRRRRLKEVPPAAETSDAS